MRTLISLLTVFLSIIMVQAQQRLCLTVNGVTKTVTLESNSSADELLALLPLTIRMTDYGGWEKVGDLPRSIASDDRRLTARPGDIMLYQSRSIVIFYGENTWEYTPIGKIDDASAAEIKDFLGGNAVDVTLSIAPDSGIDETSCGSDIPDVYNMSGRPVRTSRVADLPAGCYIVDGRKMLIR